MSVHVKQFFAYSVKRKIAFGLFIGIILIGISGLIPSWVQRQQMRRLNELPPEAYQAIRSGSVTLFSLDPEFSEAGAGLFHHHRVLGQVAVSEVSSRQRMADTIRHNIDDWRFTRASCFNPRHGLRAILGTETTDFLICFECRQLYYIRPNGTQTYHDFGDDPAIGPFEDLLAAANVPTAKAQ